LLFSITMRTHKHTKDTKDTPIKEESTSKHTSRKRPKKKTKRWSWWNETKWNEKHLI